MADCLTLLRQYNTQKKEIIERDGLVIFDKIAWPQSAKTNYLVYRPGQAAGTTKEYYTLESLLFLLKNVSLSHPMYVQRAGAQKVPVITLADRKELLGYLNGEVDSSSSIDKSVHLDMGLPAPAAKRPNDEANNEPVKKPRRDEDIQAEQKRLATILNQTGRAKGGAIQIRLQGLGDAMSMEQIAAIKAKRLAKKRGTIKTDDLEGGVDRAYMDDTTSDIMRKERAHRSRSTVLQSTGKQFSNIFSLLQTVKSRDDGKGVDMPVDQQATKPVEKPVVTQSPQAKGYDRWNQVPNKDLGGLEFKTNQTFIGKWKPGITEAAATKSRPQPYPLARSAPVSSKSPAGAALRKTETKKTDPKSRIPVIIVPQAATSAINGFNAKDFLEEFKYIAADAKRQSGVRTQNEIMIHRKRKHPSNPSQNVAVPYKVVSNPLRLSSDEWNRVVAVFVAGPMWQFKGWPGLTSDGSPVDIFTNVKAFHLKFEGQRLDPNISKWDVNILEISESRRHLDKASCLHFWEAVDKFIVKKKPDLKY